MYSRGQGNALPLPSVAFFFQIVITFPSAICLLPYFLARSNGQISDFSKNLISRRAEKSSEFPQNFQL
jgi:hypothetical protein